MSCMCVVKVASIVDSLEQNVKTGSNFCFMECRSDDTSMSKTMIHMKLYCSLIGMRDKCGPYYYYETLITRILSSISPNVLSRRRLKKDSLEGNGSINSYFRN